MDERHASSGEIKLDPTEPKRVIDYSLRRRASLEALSSGEAALEEVCDADRYLLRAAEFHGVPGTVPCPVCRKDNLVTVKWVYGNSIGDAAGSARTDEEIEELARVHDEFTVHVVEVCRSCRWNHLIESYDVGWPAGLAAKIRRAGKLRGQA
ncbi:DUF5318 family protein [Dietzia sp.]|uniref:DUF5318 family protein n=1 Tax=Dietzia sp. TaxID=1871616 RepID=UPI002FD9D4B9